MEKQCVASLSWRVKKKENVTQQEVWESLELNFAMFG